MQKLLGAVLGAVLFAAPASAQVVSVVTTPTGSFTNSVGSPRSPR